RTRGILERLARCDGLNIGIITKSPLNGRDTDVLRRIQERSDLEVHISLNTVDVALIRHVEARSPMPAVRLRALERLANAGVRVGLIVAPVLPGITDDLPHLEALFQAAREAGARFVHAGPLRLYPAVRDRFLPMLEEQLGESAPQLERLLGGEIHRQLVQEADELTQVGRSRDLALGGEPALQLDSGDAAGNRALQNVAQPVGAHARLARDAPQGEPR